MPAAQARRPGCRKKSPRCSSGGCCSLSQQNWENARHIKNERLSFTNIYCIVAAGLLSFLHTVTGKRELDGERR